MVGVLIESVVIGTLATRALGAVLATAVSVAATLLRARIVVVAWLALCPVLVIAGPGATGHPRGEPGR